MKCLVCTDGELTWNSDDAVYEPSDDFDYAVVSFYKCQKCDAWYEVYHGKHAPEVREGLINNDRVGR